MQVTDEAELWALFRAILECKFGEPRCRVEVAGSPLLGRVIERIWVDLQPSRVFQTADPPGGWRSWDTWRTLNPDRPEWKRVVKWIKALSPWDGASIEDKREAIRMLALPFVIPTEHESVLLSLYGR
jgi:hypothetical protein